jgi:hypothetical protein
MAEEKLTWENKVEMVRVILDAMSRISDPQMRERVRKVADAIIAQAEAELGIKEG